MVIATTPAPVDDLPSAVCSSTARRTFPLYFSGFFCILIIVAYFRTGTAFQTSLIFQIWQLLCFRCMQAINANTVIVLSPTLPSTTSPIWHMQFGTYTVASSDNNLFTLVNIWLTLFVSCLFDNLITCYISWIFFSVFFSIFLVVCFCACFLLPKR